MSKKGWWGVDLDGTLAFYDTFNPVIGEPIPKMQERVKRWLAEGREVRIVTARVSPKDSQTMEEVEQIRTMVEDWCEKHLGKRLVVTNEKDHGMIELWDDRAVGVVKNTGERVCYTKK